MTIKSGTKVRVYNGNRLGEIFIVKDKDSPNPKYFIDLDDRIVPEPFPAGPYSAAEFEVVTFKRNRQILSCDE